MEILFSQKIKQYLNYNLILILVLSVFVFYVSFIDILQKLKFFN